MSNEIHETPPPPAATLISADLKKMLVVPTMTLFVAIVVAWYAAQGSQVELRVQMADSKEKIAANTANIKANADAMNQIVISIARLSENQTRLAADLKQISDDQRAMILQNSRR